jgi:hypothetical protein
VAAAEVQVAYRTSKVGELALVAAMLSGDMSVALEKEGSATRADLEGRFTVATSVPTAEAELRVTADGYQAWTQPLPESSPVEVQLVRRVERTISGRVVDGRGAPVTAFAVGGRWLFDEGGRFAVPEVFYELELKAPGFARESVKVPEGEASVDVGTITLRPAAALTVIVRDEAGAPQSGVLAKLANAIDDASCVTEQGRCRLGDLTPEKLTIEVTAADTEPVSREVEVRDASTTLEVTLKRALGAVEGFARGADGVPLAGGLVHLFGLGQRQTASSGADGTYRFDRLPSGEATVGLRDALGGGAMVRVQVGRTLAKVDVGPEPSGARVDGVIRGAATDGQGGQVIAVRAAAPAYRGGELLEPGPELFRPGVTHVVWTRLSAGRFALAGLPPGRWALYLGVPANLTNDAVKPLATLELAVAEHRTLEL